jgi:CheY-like chemotaxis protein
VTARLLFVDDDPENVDFVARTLRDALDAHVRVVTTVEDAVEALLSERYDIVVTDVFIPLGVRPGGVLGPRARRHEEQVEHLGGLVLLDEIDRLDPAPRILAHTACVDPVLIQLLGERVVERVRKPAPGEVLLDAVLRALRDG